MRKFIEKYRRKWYMLPWLVCGTTVVIQGNVTRFQYAICLVGLLYFMWTNERLDRFANLGSNARKGRYRGRKEDENAGR